MATVTVFASAFRATLSSKENMLRSFKALQFVSEYAIGTVKQGVGVYHEEGESKPSHEVTCIVTINEYHLDEVIEYFIKEVEQDCVLVVDNHNNANLVFEDNVECIGQMVKVPKRSTEKLDCYTYINGDYYTCV